MPQVVATRYANALADSISVPASAIRPQQALGELQLFERMLAESSDLRNILYSPAVPSARKRAVIGRFAEILPLSKIVRNLLFVLIDRRRIGLFTEIREAFEIGIDDRQGTVRAQVTSAVELNAEQRSRVEAELGQVAGRPVRCDFKVDPELLGGVVARIGSTVYDGSVRSQLSSLRQKLVAR